MCYFISIQGIFKHQILGNWYIFILCNLIIVLCLEFHTFFILLHISFFINLFIANITNLYTQFYDKYFIIFIKTCILEHGFSNSFPTNDLIKTINRSNKFSLTYIFFLLLLFF